MHQKGDIGTPPIIHLVRMTPAVSRQLELESVNASNTTALSSAQELSTTAFAVGPSSQSLDGNGSSDTLVGRRLSGPMVAQRPRDSEHS